MAANGKQRSCLLLFFMPDILMRFAILFFFGFVCRRFKAFPKGNIKANNSFSLFLEVADNESLPIGWRRHAKFSFNYSKSIFGKTL